MSDQDNLSAVPQKTLERLAQLQNEIAAIEKLIDQRRDELSRREDELAALSDKLFRAKDLRDEVKRTVEEYEEMLAARVPQEPAGKPEIVAGRPARVGSCRPTLGAMNPDDLPDQRGPLAVPTPPVGERVLKVLWRAGKPVAAREITEALGLRPNAVGVSLANLKRAGLGSKDPDTGLWEILPKGISLAETTP